MATVQGVALHPQVGAQVAEQHCPASHTHLHRGSAATRRHPLPPRRSPWGVTCVAVDVGHAAG